MSEDRKQRIGLVTPRLDFGLL